MTERNITAELQTYPNLRYCGTGHRHEANAFCTPAGVAGNATTKRARRFLHTVVTAGA